MYLCQDCIQYYTDCQMIDKKWHERKLIRMLKRFIDDKLVIIPFPKSPYLLMHRESSCLIYKFIYNGIPFEFNIDCFTNHLLVGNVQITFPDKFKVQVACDCLLSLAMNLNTVNGFLL